ncbi:MULTISPECIES: ROK family protein [Corynebacterium]|uniref:Glucokinase n=1 Tax=Corynebacterium imitans TaxID=156978 RepID=A0A076NKF4_9CORY|nr:MULTISPECIES: ROK family protein [Corynebacterium]AIJ33903.1 glucokinase [Corynebacterium imitans]OFP34701.1 glucokinase [Corynebacterium sp. HMSC071B10]OHF36149.1 glucokinase [Corynebacterium sp. HMSC074A01]SNV76918.1 Glucose kinase [Corynebacterium imitans]
MSLHPGPLTIGFDIGGTNLRAAVVDANGQILDAASTSTPQTGSEMTAAIVELAHQLRASHDIAAVGLAVAGFLDPDCEIVRFAPHLPWRDDYPLRKKLADELGLPVRLEHDANSAAWGEYRFGAARDAETWVLFAVGTGIGATLMHRGEIYRGSFGTAPEFGHLTVVPGGRACSCGKQGCLERYASGSSLVDCAVEIATRGGYKRCGLYRKVVGKHATGRDVMEAARAGDELGLAALDSFATWLGRGLAIVADVLDPALIVLGGGVAADASMFIDTARETMAATMVGAGYRPVADIQCAELGPQAGMIGVADLARTMVHEQQ